MRNDATSTDLRDDRATQASSDRCATLSDTVLAGLSRIFSPATARAIVEAASAGQDGSGREIDVEFGAIDGTPRRARARIDFIATEGSVHCCVLTILPSPSRANLLRAVPDVVFELDADGIYVDFSGPEEALLEPRQFVGKSITETLPADVAHRALAALERLREHGGREYFEYALSMSDGLHWYEARLRSLASGGAVAHVRDITEHKTTEWRCQESEERCRVLDADLKARTLDLERAHRELEILRRSTRGPPPKTRTRAAQTK